MIRCLALVALVGCASTQTTRPAPEAPAPAPETEAVTEAPVTAPPSAPEPARELLPGDSIGPVTASTSRADLAERLGEDALKDQDIGIGEGMNQAGTVVFPDTARELHVVWRTDARERAERVVVYGTDWTLPGGLHRGSTFTDVQQALGPFEMFGFGWDYEGTVRLPGTKMAAYDGQLILRLAPPADANTQGLLGDNLFASDNSELVALAPSLDTIIALFPE